MKKLICSLVVLSLLVIIANNAKADEHRGETEWWVTVEGEMAQNQAETLGARATTLFILPTSAYVYAGPWWAPTSWLWLSPQVGVTSTIDGVNDDAAVSALWLSVTPTKWLALFGDVEGWSHERGTDVYKYASADGLIGPFNIGGQIESINDSLTVGPHFGLTKKPWGVELQTHFDPKNEIWFGRVVGKIKF